MDAKTAAAICSIMIVCWAAASPLFGAFSDRIGVRKRPYLGGSVACAVGWLTLIYGGLPLPLSTAVAALTSFATGCVIIAFAYAKESVPGKDMGAATASTNIGNMLGNVFLQPGIGMLLDHNWSGAMVNGARIYSAAAFQTGFIPIAAWAVLSSLCIMLTSETRCRQRD